MSHPHHTEAGEPPFSIALFLVTIAVTLGVLCGALALIAPQVWAVQLAAGWLPLLGAFLGLHVVAGITEFFFHRYVLHAPLVSFLSYFYKQHTRHHALTRIGYQKSAAGGEIPCLVEVANRFPIEEEKQHEASYFPWYSLAVFSLVALPGLVLVQWLLPAAPILLGGFLGIAWSLSLYELIHAVEHLPQQTWDRLLAHPRYARFWRKAYAFHLRHHADIRCNEGISGVFGFPLVDLVLGTYVDPETLYTHGNAVHVDQFSSPRPRFAVIRWLDRQAELAVNRRRKKRTASGD